MPGRNYFLLSALPGLGGLGSDPPIGLEEFLGLLAEAPRPRADAQAVFLGEDLRQRDAMLAGEIDAPAPIVLSAEQVRDEAPLPDYLAPAEDADAAPAVGGDRVWEAYFRHLACLGGHSAFLAAWVAHEVGLRNALAGARAKALSLDAQRYLVAADLGATGEDFAPVLGEWSSAATPLAGLRALDTERWQWLTDHDGWFTFADDELDAYAAKLLLLHRWKRIADAERAAQAESA